MVSDFQRGLSCSNCSICYVSLLNKLNMESVENSDGVYAPLPQVTLTPISLSDFFHRFIKYH